MSKQNVSAVPTEQPIATKRSTVTKKPVVQASVASKVVQTALVSTPASVASKVVQITPVPAPAPAQATVAPKVVQIAPNPPKVSIVQQIDALKQVVSESTEVKTIEPIVQETVETVAEKVNNNKRPFLELYEEMSKLVDETYKRTQLLVKLHKSLLQAHKREVSSTSHRESTKRTPTTLFDRPLVEYFHSRLTPTERVIIRKNAGVKETVDLSNFDENTRFHRTDVTQLCSLVFKKHKLTDPSDGRKILYQNDTELVKLLTTGSYDPKLESAMESIRKGTQEMNIFTIQQFLNHRLRRVVKEESNSSV